MNENWLAELIRQIRFVGRAEITAPFEACFELAFCMAFLQRLHGVVIKLTRLRQIGFFVAKIIDLEKRRCAFARGRCEYRRIGENEAVAVKIIANSFYNSVTNFENRVLFPRPYP